MGAAVVPVANSLHFFFCAQVGPDRKKCRKSRHRLAARHASREGGAVGLRSGVALTAGLERRR